MSHVTFFKEIPGLYAQELLTPNASSMHKNHLHEAIELLFLLEGDRHYFIDHYICHVEPGMGILLNKNQMHYSCLLSDKKKYHRFLLYLDATVLDKYFSLPGIPSLTEIGENYWGPTEFSEDDWQSILTTIEMLKSNMLLNTEEGNAQALLCVMNLLMIFLRNRRQHGFQFNNTPPSTSKARTNIYQTVQDIIIYMQGHSNEPCSLDDIASHFFISRTYLARIFKLFTGYTITEYRTFCRIQKSKELLLKTNMSITDIAAQSGYESISQFEKNFKTLTESTPLQFRRKYSQGK